MQPWPSEERSRRRPRGALRGPAALAPPPPSWAARLLALALTLLMLAIVGLSIGVRLDEARRPFEDARAAEARSPERIVFLPVPKERPTPSVPRSSTSAPSSPVAPAPGRAFPFPGVESPGAPAGPPAPTDSAPGPRRSNTAPVPTPRAVFTPPPCAAPCAERLEKPRTYGGAGVLSNGQGPPAMTAAERDSALRDVARRTREATVDGSSGPIGAGDPRAPGGPAPQVGVSIPMGLPGGGPSRAQRKRDSTLDAEIAARLARVKARADSIEKARRDSAAKRP